MLVIARVDLLEQSGSPKIIPPYVIILIISILSSVARMHLVESFKRSVPVLAHTVSEIMSSRTNRTHYCQLLHFLLLLPLLASSPLNRNRSLEIDQELSILAHLLILREPKCFYILRISISRRLGLPLWIQ